MSVKIELTEKQVEDAKNMIRNIEQIGSATVPEDEETREKMETRVGVGINAQNSKQALMDAEDGVVVFDQPYELLRFEAELRLAMEAARTGMEPVFNWKVVRDVRHQIEQMDEVFENGQTWEHKRDLYPEDCGCEYVESDVPEVGTVCKPCPEHAKGDA